VAQCKFCGQEISWIHTPEGKAVPIDPDPVFIVEDGSKDVFYLEDREPPITGRVARKEEESVDLEVGFVPHNRTCAYWHQKTKRGGGYG